MAEVNLALANKLKEIYFKKGAYRIPDDPRIRKQLREHVIFPLLYEAGKKLYKQGGNLSNARKGLPKVYIGGKLNSLSSVSQYITGRIENKEFKNPSFSDTEDRTEDKSARREALTGAGPLGQKQIAFKDEITRLKKIKNQNLKRTSPKSITKRNNILAQFDKDMANLFRENRDWLPRVNNRPMQYFPGDEDLYGWKERDSEKDFLRWQSGSYKDEQSAARTWFHKYGMQAHAGHGFSAGGLTITPEQMKKFDIPTRQLIRADGTPDPDNEGSWILKGTNSMSNLAIELAKKNLSHGKDITRNLEDLRDLNVAFSKSLSFQEYLNRNDTSYRKNTDFSQKIQSFLLHSQEDINALQAQGEIELLETGPQEIDRSIEKFNPQRGSFNILPNSTKGGEIKRYFERGGIQFSKKIEDAVNIRNQFKGFAYSELKEDSAKRFEKTKSELEKGYEKTYQFKDPTQTKLDIGSKVSETALRNLPVSKEVIQGAETANLVNKAISGDISSQRDLAGKIVTQGIKNQFKTEYLPLYEQLPENVKDKAIDNLWTGTN